MDLHCSPPSNALEHGLAVIGHSGLSFMAIVDAFVKLAAETRLGG
jgi:hypothetical protein